MFSQLKPLVLEMMEKLKFETWLVVILQEFLTNFFKKPSNFFVNY
jgi:hypothetical protein